MAHLFIVVVYDSFNRNNVKISKTYNFPDFSFFMSQDDAHYHNHQNAPLVIIIVSASVFVVITLSYVTDSTLLLS